MPTTAYTSQGSLLKVAISSAATTIPGVKGLTGPSVNTDFADITNLTSTGAYKEWQPIMKDPGGVSFDMIYDPADPAHEYLRAANVSQAKENFTLILSDAGAATMTFAAYIAKFEFKLGIGEVLMVSVELKLTGAITFTP